jgi:proteasome lid subunit RPN8/RPN11
MKRWRLFARQPSPKRPRNLTPGSATTTAPVPTTLAAPPARPPRGPRGALPLFTKTHEQAMGYCEDLARSLASDLAQADLDALLTLYERASYHLGVVTSARFALEQATAEPSQSAETLAPATPEYLLSSWFLSRSQLYLTGHPVEERMHLVAGVHLAPKRRTLDHLVTVTHNSQSAVHAQADQHALLTVLREIEAWGHVVTGLFHSHPGIGAGMTRPSTTDLETQERYEAGGYPMVSAICTRDGWFRFFGHQPFTITLFGQGVIQHEEHLFQIQSRAAYLPHPPR